MPAAWVSAGVGVAGLLSGGSASKKQAKQQEQAQAFQQVVQFEQLKMAKDQWQRYLDTYAPLEQEYVAEARNAGSIANQNKAAGQVAAENASAFAGAREKLSKNPGASPSSQAYLQEQNRINLAEAASSATSQNNAREKVISRGDARMTDALSLGKGLPAQAASTLSVAGSTGYGLMRAGIDQAEDQFKNDMTGIGTFGKAIGGLTNAKAFQNWVGGLNSGSPTFTQVPSNPNYTPTQAGDMQSNFFFGNGTGAD